MKNAYHNTHTQIHVYAWSPITHIYYEYDIEMSTHSLIQLTQVLSTVRWVCVMYIWMCKSECERTSERASERYERESGITREISHLIQLVYCEFGRMNGRNGLFISWNSLFLRFSGTHTHTLFPSSSHSLSFSSFTIILSFSFTLTAKVHSVALFSLLSSSYFFLFFFFLLVYYVEYTQNVCVRVCVGT